jgi:hypothetical protein
MLLRLARGPGFVAKPQPQTTEARLLTPSSNRRRGSSFGPILFCTALLAALGPPVQAQALPLPVDEQDAVNRAIEQGVDYLKKSQGKNGTWARAKMPHAVGYAALPGLTLLECGVAPSDPLIQRTAHYLRSHAAKLNATYELSLGVLFLDRLGDPQDKKLIQMFALRLIAGQSATGGWGYKCPILSPHLQMELFTALRHLDPPRPQGMPGIVGGPARKPGDLAPVTQVPGRGLQGATTAPGTSSLPGSTIKGSPGTSLSPQESIDSSPSLWRDWLGFPPPDGADHEPGSADHPDKTPDKKDTKGQAAKPDDGKPADPAKPYILPERVQRFAVVQDPAQHVLVDPLRRPRQVFLTTTDNSNTQFAILALWTAQRYDVPMNRTLNLIVRRYATSQRADGAWSYRYLFGGGPIPSAPMTCVGLIGLAVGHGLGNADDRPVGQPVRDPRIINGLVALSSCIGKPANRTVNLPMQNLYFLWSLERAAVLYNLPTIGDKDWYRWGAEILVANQDGGGNWVGGLYPGNSPTIDTCLALLFLKRANLVKDLTAKLPFKPADLQNGIMEKLTPPSPKKSAEPIEKKTLPIEPPQPAEPEKLISKPLHDTTATMPMPDSGIASESENGGKMKWVILSFAFFVILAGGSLIFFLIAAKRKKEEQEKKPKGSKGKRKKKSMASPQDV